MNYPPSIQKLIDLFSEFPTVGPRTASRFVFYLMRLSKDEVQDFMIAISKLRDSVKICSLVLIRLKVRGELCEICSNPIARQIFALYCGQ